MATSNEQFVEELMAEADADADVRPDSEVLSGKRVLIVDDNRFVRQIFHAQLTQLEMIPVEADNGYTGLAMLRRCHQSRTPVDAILLDILMPEMGGHEMLRKIRERDLFREIPVIMTTTQSEMESVQACARLRISDYILKPVMPERLRRALRKAIA